jgi:DNA-directed RNA polymerase subunit RPC12/RpoP
LASPGRLLGDPAQASDDTGGAEASRPTAEGTVKLVCEKCRRVVEVRKRDVDELYLCLECWRPLLAPPGHAEARHLVCPFCAVEGNGIYWLGQLRQPRAAKQGGTA